MYVVVLSVGIVSLHPSFATRSDLTAAHERES